MENYEMPRINQGILHKLWPIELKFIINIVDSYELETKFSYTNFSLNIKPACQILVFKYLGLDRVQRIKVPALHTAGQGLIPNTVFDQLLSTARSDPQE